MLPASAVRDAERPTAKESCERHICFHRTVETSASKLTVIVTAVLASIGTAGMPGAGAIMLLLVLDSAGLPVREGTPVALAYALVLGIDALLDMGRTSLNVTGDLIGTTLVANSEGELDRTGW